MKKTFTFALVSTLLLMMIYSCKKEKNTTNTTTTTPATTVTDIDGNVYNIITIGSQSWLKENLKVTKYRNGDVIGTTSGSTSGDPSPKYQWPADGNEANVSVYGRLYTYYVVTDSRGLAPTGWHIPSQTEWETLVTNLGGNMTLVGGMLKETGTVHWQTPNSASNTNGFTALPSGLRQYSAYIYFGICSAFWSTTATTSTEAYTPYMYNNATDLLTNGSTKNYGYSVRCIKD